MFIGRIRIDKYETVESFVEWSVSSGTG